MGHDPDRIGRTRRLAGLLLDRASAWRPGCRATCWRCRRWRCSSGDGRRVGAAAGPAAGRRVGHGHLGGAHHARLVVAGRQVVVVVPCLVLAVAWWVARARAARWLLGAAAAFGVLAGAGWWSRCSTGGAR